MDTNNTLYIVESADAIRQTLVDYFGQVCATEGFATARECLDRVAVTAPDAFVLALDLPDIDGFALCQALRELPACQNTPILFYSNHGDLDTHLAGYDAGGDDFVNKTVPVQELRQRIEVLVKAREESRFLHRQMEDSDTLTSLVLANLDEYAVLVKFLRTLNGCETYSQIAESIHGMLASYHLDGVVQFRLPGFELTIGQDCSVRPLESSILNQVRDLGAIAEYKSRAAFNYKTISVLVFNMPLHDPELCGRLRDHLAISVETADSRVQSITIHNDNVETKSEIAEVLGELGRTIESFRKRYEAAYRQGEGMGAQVLAELDSEFANLGMREVQEDSIKGMVRKHTDELMAVFDFSSETESVFNDLSGRLLSRLQTD